MASIDGGALWELTDALKGLSAKRGETQLNATVSGVDEDGTVWVQIEGSDDVAPVNGFSYANVARGDSVTVGIDGETMNLIGNWSQPSVGLRDVQSAAGAIVNNITGQISAAAKAAEKLASEARRVASATNQHFWHRSTDPDEDGAGTGAFVTDEEQETFLQAIADGTEPTEQRPLHNLLMNSEGVLIRAAKYVRAAFTQSAVAFYDGMGNTAANIIARFGADGAQIGKDGGTHLNLESDGIRITDDMYTWPQFDVVVGESEIAYGEELADALEQVPYTFSLGQTPKEGSVIVLCRTESGVNPPSEQEATYTYVLNGSELTITDTRLVGHICVVNYIANGEGLSLSLGPRKNGLGKGYLSTSVGFRNAAVGENSHAEGTWTVAMSSDSHAEGAYSEANGAHSHAEGYKTKANNSVSHAEGSLTVASGKRSHSQNLGTVAQGTDQTAMGRYNEVDANDVYALIIGNGTSDSNRSNAYAVQWDGTVEMGTDVPWTLLTLNSACHAYNDVSANAPRYRRWGQLVTVTGIIAPTAEVAAGGIMAISTLPAGVRPPQELNIKCQGSVRAAWNLKITAAGVMSAQRYGDENGAQAMATNIWLPFTATYLV